MASVNQATNLVTPLQSGKELQNVLSDILTDITNLRTAFVALTAALDIDSDQVHADVTALRAAIVGITAQLDADAGVTDITYASGNDPAALTLTNQTFANTDPAALNTTT